MAARFELGPDSSVSEISTRVRVNNYTNVHAVAELSDGKLYIGENLREGFRRLLGSGRQERRRGERQTRPDALQAVRKAERGVQRRRPRSQIMIGHPNNSGLQMDQVTMLYVPAFFAMNLRAMAGTTTLVLAMEGGISISEDPIFDSPTFLQWRRRQEHKAS